MPVVADPEAISFIAERGGRLYVYTDVAAVPLDEAKRIASEFVDEQHVR